MTSRKRHQRIASSPGSIGTLSDYNSDEEGDEPTFASPFTDETDADIPIEALEGKAYPHVRDKERQWIAELFHIIFSEDIDISKLRNYWPIIWFILIGFIMFQDNQENLLNDWSGWLWFAFKVLVISIVMVVFIIIIKPKKNIT